MSNEKEYTARDYVKAGARLVNELGTSFMGGALLGILLPNMNGGTVVKILKSACSTVATFAMTETVTRSTNKVLDEYVDAGADLISAVKAISNVGKGKTKSSEEEPNTYKDKEPETYKETETPYHNDIF